MSELLNKIKTRGHWRVLIRPNRFVENRIPVISDLYRILEKTSVRLRGWDFPHLDPSAQPHVDANWVGQEFEWDMYLEIWRFYQSGQFVHISGMPSDWRDQSGLSPVDQNWKPSAWLGIGDTLFTFQEVFELAARLALTAAGDEQMRVEVTASGLEGRALLVDSHRRLPMFREHRASIHELPYKIDIGQADLVADPREFALKAAVELFRRFNWEPSLQMLQEWY